MRRLCCLLVPALLLCACESVTVDIGANGRPFPRPERRAPERVPSDPDCGPGDYAGLPQRTSFSPKSDVVLKEGCYVGDFELGSSQIEVRGAGVGKTVIHGNLILKTQCEVSNLTVTGDVIFEGHQAKLVDCDFFGRIIDKGMQNRY